VSAHKSAVNARERERERETDGKMDTNGETFPSSVPRVTLPDDVRDLLDDGDRFCPEPKYGVNFCAGKNQPILRFDVRHVRDETGVCVNERLVSESKLES